MDIIGHDGIFYNGACIVHNFSKNYQFIDEEMIKKVIEIIFPFQNVNIVLQMENEIHSFRFELPLNDYKLWGIDNNDTSKIDSRNGHRTVKIVILGPLPELNSIYNELLQFSDYLNIYLTDNGNVIQIIPIKVNKNEAIRKIIKNIGIKSDEYAVFGDDLPDLEMIEQCDFGVAMGNAHVESHAIFT